jgi:ABC-type transport system involved in multi-copper enzyme maturation permease subunit
MKFLAYRALARSVVLESIRRKDLWVVAILGFLIILASSTLGFFGFDGLEVFAKDLAVTVLGMFSSIIGVLTACRLIPDEIKNRTLYPLLARPITRMDLLIGKLLGSIFVTWIAFLVLAVLTGIALMIFRVQFEPIMLQYLVLKMMGLIVVCAVSLALSAYMTPSAGATMSFILVFGCPMFIRALTMGYESAGPTAKLVFPFLNAILPQFSLFDMGGRAVYPNWSPVPMWILGFMLGYALLYSTVMVGIGWVKFRKQAV